MNSELLWNKTKTVAATPIAWVLMGGLFLRIYSAATRTIINPDGVQYIYQASTIFNLAWSELFTCKLAYISPLPFLVAATFAVCRDWIVAAQAVNVIFGWATLLPLFYLLRRVFDESVSTLTVLIFALIPVLVAGSGDVIRGPMFWFFVALGMLFFVRQWDAYRAERRFRYDLMMSAIFFLLAAWSRIEGVVFLAAPWFYLLITRTEHKLQRCICFLLPLILASLGAIGAAVISGRNIETTLRISQIVHEVTQFATNYAAVETWIREAYAQQGGLYGEFLRRAREILGLMPLLVIAHSFLEGIFYPFALIYFVGLIRIGQRYRRNRHILFFLWQSLAGFIVLYIHTLQAWFVSYRFLAVVIFPGCVIMANGIEETVNCLRNRRQWPIRKAIGVTAAILIIAGLPKNLKPEERDKAVYRQAALVIARQGGADQPVKIAALNRSRALEWIVLYAHRHHTRIPCSEGITEAVTTDFDQLISHLDRTGIRYVLCEERYWPHNLNMFSLADQDRFHLLGQWRHSDSKTFMLFEVARFDP